MTAEEFLATNPQLSPAQISLIQSLRGAGSKTEARWWALLEVPLTAEQQKTFYTLSDFAALVKADETEVLAIRQRFGERPLRGAAWSALFSEWENDPQSWQSCGAAGQGDEQGRTRWGIYIPVVSAIQQIPIGGAARLRDSDRFYIRLSAGQLLEFVGVAVYG